jgi:Ca2+-binding EF-hand superfamily protein
MLSEFQKKKVDRLFETFDRNGDGHVTYEDWYDSAAEAALDLYPSKEEAQHYLKNGLEADLRPWWDFLTQLDRNADGLISAEEFRDGYENVFVQDIKGLSGVCRNVVGAWFDLGDANGDGVLSRDEFVRLWTLASRQTPEASARVFEQFTADVDTGGDKFLTRERYQGLFLDYLVGDDPDSASSGALGELPNS